MMQAIRLSLLIALLIMFLSGCGSTLPEGRMLYAPAVIPTEEEVQNVSHATKLDGVVVPFGVRVLSEHVAVVDLMMIPPAYEHQPEVSNPDIVKMATTALCWRYAGVGEGILLKSQGKRVALLPAFYDSMTEEERRLDGLSDMRSAPLLVNVGRKELAYCVPIVIRTETPLQGGALVDIRIKRSSKGLAGLQPYEGWVSVPVTRFGE